MLALGAALAVFFAGLGAFLDVRWAGGGFAPGDATAPELVPFQGGSAPAVHAWSRFHARYHAMALLVRGTAHRPHPVPVV